MIDIHCHILPNIDDGARDIDESLALLRMQFDQGADTVIATSHFYAMENNIDAFLAKRNNAFELLTKSPEFTANKEPLPKIKLGAEVLFFDGIQNVVGLEKLCIEGTNFILIEMPFDKWSDRTLRELSEIQNVRNLNVILAHLERYEPFNGTEIIPQMAEEGYLIQSNCAYFLDFFTRRRALKYLDCGFINFIGSDCHRIPKREPKLKEAKERIENKFGKEFFEDFQNFGKNTLQIK